MTSKLLGLFNKKLAIDQEVKFIKYIKKQKIGFLDLGSFEKINFAKKK